MVKRVKRLLQRAEGDGPRAERAAEKLADAFDAWLDRLEGRGRIDDPGLRGARRDLRELTEDGVDALVAGARDWIAEVRETITPPTKPGRIVARLERKVDAGRLTEDEAEARLTARLEARIDRQEAKGRLSEGEAEILREALEDHPALGRSVARFRDFKETTLDGGVYAGAVITGVAPPPPLDVVTVAMGEEEPDDGLRPDPGDPVVTTLAIGEEDGDGPPVATTWAIGEEDADGVTTLGIGEEDCDEPPFATTDMVGEEEDDFRFPETSAAPGSTGGAPAAESVEMPGEARTAVFVTRLGEDGSVVCEMLEPAGDGYLV